MRAARLPPSLKAFERPPPSPARSPSPACNTAVSPAGLTAAALGRQGLHFRRQLAHCTFALLAHALCTSARTLHTALLHCSHIHFAHQLAHARALLTSAYIRGDDVSSLRCIRDDGTAISTKDHAQYNNARSQPHPPRPARPRTRHEHRTDRGAVSSSDLVIIIIIIIIIII